MTPHQHAPIAPLADVHPRQPGKARVTNRLVFANQLRGLAALAVAYSHLVGVFWAMPGLVSAVTASNAPAGPPGWLLPYIYINGFNPGPFGVGVFFLISGLVISLSLQDRSRASFLLARALRIIPVYAAALAIEVIVLRLSAGWWQHPLAVDAWAVLANLLLVGNAYVGLPDFDLVNWTLCIEAKFYILAALLAGPIRRGSVWALFAAAAGVAIVSSVAAAASAPGGRVIVAFGTDCSYLVFILIGVLFSYRLRGLVSRAALAGSVAGMLGLFLVCWYGSAAAAANVFRYNTVNYLYAVAVFGGLFALRRHVRPFWPLDAMAAISYPFYLLHMLVGLSGLRLLTAGLGMPYLPAVAITLAAVMALATALHLTVERWSMRAGRRLAVQGIGARWSPAPAQ